MKTLILLIFLLVISFGAYAQDTLLFQSVQTVLTYADNHSVTFKNANQQTVLAKYQTLAAQLGKWNLKGDINVTATDNTQLQTNFIPAIIFGGPTGTFRRVTLGEQYVSLLQVSPQFDILNPYSIALVKVSKANEQVTNIANLLSKKNLYESLAGSYYNIRSYQWQIASLETSLKNADTLTLILQNKQKEGLARSQDVNNTIANQIAIRNKLQQLQIQLSEEYENLKLLCDIDPAVHVGIQTQAQDAIDFDASLTATGNLEEQQGEGLRNYQLADLDANKKWYLPTLGFISNFSSGQYSNSRFFDGSPILNSSYVGLKLTITLLPDINKIAKVKYDRINLQIAENNLLHLRLQDSVNNRQLLLEYRKTYASYQLFGQIEYIKKDSYQKNLNIYKEGLYSATDLLNSFNDWLNSSLDTDTQLANTEFEKTKIIINNTIK
jgi:outer membrane protein TolC